MLTDIPLVILACFVAVACTELAVAVANVGARFATPRALWITLIATAVAFHHYHCLSVKTMAELKSANADYEYYAKITRGQIADLKDQLKKCSVLH